MDDHLYPHTTLLSHIHMYVKIFCTKSLPAWHTKVEGIWSGWSTTCANSKVFVDFYWNKQRSFSTFSDASANLSPPPLLVLQSVLLKIFNNSVEQLQINLTCAKPVKCKPFMEKEILTKVFSPALPSLPSLMVIQSSLAHAWLIAWAASLHKISGQEARSSSLWKDLAIVQQVLTEENNFWNQPGRCQGGRW